MVAIMVAIWVAIKVAIMVAIKFMEQLINFKIKIDQIINFSYLDMVN